MYATCSMKEEIVNRECIVLACSMLQSRYLKSRADKSRSRERQIFARSTRLYGRSNLSIATSASDPETVNAPLFLRVLIKRLWRRLNSLKNRVAIMVVFRIAAISLARHEIAERRVTVLVLRQIADDTARSLISIREKLVVQGIAQPCLPSHRDFSLFQIIHTNTEADSEKATFTSRIRFRPFNSFYFVHLTLYCNISGNNYTVMYAADGEKGKSINSAIFISVQVTNDAK